MYKSDTVLGKNGIKRVIKGLRKVTSNAKSYSYNKFRISHTKSYNYVPPMHLKNWFCLELHTLPTCEFF